MQLQSKSAASLSNSLIITISKFQIMKKTYINPEIIVVRLMPTTVLAESTPQVTVSTDSSNSVDAGSVETKGVSNVNVWDEEW